MTWWAWLILGLVLMGVEMFAVDAAFYLIFIGFAAVCMGLLGLVGITLPIWGQLMAFAMLALVFMVFFRQKLYNRFRGGLPGFDATSTGKLVTVPVDLPVGGETRVKMRGTQWTAVNVGEAAIEEGASAKVVSSDGLTLNVQASEPAHTTTTTDNKE